MDIEKQKEIDEANIKDMIARRGIGAVVSEMMSMTSLKLDQAIEQNIIMKNALEVIVARDVTFFCMDCGWHGYEGYSYSEIRECCPGCSGKGNTHCLDRGDVAEWALNEIGGVE